MYAQASQDGPEGAGAAGAEEAKQDDDVVDADFEEVKEDDNKDEQKVILLTDHLSAESDKE